MRHHPAKYATRLQVGDDVLGEALRLQRRGISVIPIGGEKKPALRTWKPFQSVAADERQVRDWFDRRDDLGLAIVLGPVSGNLIARDFDLEAAWMRWASQYPNLERMLPYAETRRGRHVYARIADCPASTYEDGELRASGQYVVAPPSLHPSGCRYRWGRGFDALSDVPALTLAESGFGRCWLPSDGEQSHDTDRTEVDLSDLCLSVSCAPLIQATLPHAFGTRRHRLFGLARRIRVDPQLREVPIHELRPLVAEWHKLALPFIRTKPFDETWADFVEAYGNVDLARSGDAAEMAMAAAESKELPSEARGYMTPLIQRLVALCAELGRSSAEGTTFFLSCRKAASVLGTSDYKSVARWLQMLVADRLLGEVVKGGPHNNKATRYEWKGRREAKRQPATVTRNETPGHFVATPSPPKPSR